MTDKIILTERQQSMDQCLKACVNLYGFVTPRQFLKVFNRFNKPKLLKKELLENAEVLEAYSGWFYAIYENAIINTRVKQDVINSIAHMQSGKEYYTPSQEEVSLYSKTNYYPRTEYTEEIMQFLTKTVKANVFAANNFIVELVWLTVIDEPMQERINLLNKYGITINNIRQLTVFTQLLKELNNNTKKWANCGYTPAELRQITK